MDALIVTQLASIVNDVTEARNEAEKTGSLVLVDTLNRALIRLAVVEERVSGFVSYRVRQP